MTRRLLALSLSALVGLSAGWAGAVGASGFASTAAPDIRTASDQTDAERRARVRLALASAYFTQGQFETALDEVKQAVSIHADLADAWALRGLIYAALERTALAESSFARARALAPDDAGLLHNHAWFLCQQGQHEPAQRAFARALAQPGYRDVVKTLLAQGVCESLAGRDEQALRTLQAAHDREPGHPAVQANLAAVLARLGHTQRAAELMREVNRRPAWASPQTLWLGARLAQRLGQADEAQALVQQLRTRYPNTPETRAAQQGVHHD